MTIHDTSATTIIGVIGRCSVSACSRPAVRHVLLHPVRSATICGAVCEHCARATWSAAFLVDLIA